MEREEEGSKRAWVIGDPGVLSHLTEEASRDLTWRSREVEEQMGHLKKHWLEILLDT